MQHTLPNTKPWTVITPLILAALFSASACKDNDADPQPDAGDHDAAQAGTGGVGGTGGEPGPDSGLEGTRCDNGVGAGGDGCGESFGGWPGFVVTPSPLTTGRAKDDAVVVTAQSLFTIPDDVLDTLQNHTTLRRADDDSAVAVDAQWQSVVSWATHDASITLTPSADLAEGWYVVRVEGTLDTGHGTLIAIPEVSENVYESHFRVGSAPFVRGVANCVDQLTLSVSEPLTWPATLPIVVSAQGNTVTCTRVVEDGEDDAPTTELVLSCAGLDTWQALSIAVAEGLESDSGIALRDYAGDTNFTIELSPFGTGGGCRSIEEITEPPTF